MIGIIYPNDGWILNKIGREIVKVGGVLDNKRSDITYWVNWCYWKILHPNLQKSKFDMVLFTHFDNNSKIYLDVLDKADLIICMSDHGSQELIKHNIPPNRIKVCPYLGVSINIKKKVVIGNSGRNYNTDRKNWKEVERLKKDLDNNIFEFRHCDTTDDKFFENIDYFLQVSTAEGGSMDILNAIYSRTPVISRDIGFIHTFKTDSDFIYNNYEGLLMYFKNIEENVKQKDNLSANFTWDNFRNWHAALFKELANG